ncbi:MAG: hypothetical protein IT371_30390 [Deltaproteobacteria bacterium]|nr:hypothetical protein [Deltaproteobacteria bacterium]
MGTDPAGLTAPVGIPTPMLVLRDQKVCGAENVDEFVQLVNEGLVGPGGVAGATPPEEAFTKEWSHDAHFVCYGVIDAPDATGEVKWVEPSWPRCNKASVQPLKDRGVKIVMNFAAFDLDTKDHKAWGAGPDDPHVDAYVAGLAKAFANDPLLSEAYAFYVTKKGARLVYKLAKPIDVERVEPFLCGLAKRLEDAGVTLDAGTFKVDWACVDWTRLFRLPKVMREGKPTWPCEIDLQPRNEIDLTAITIAVKPRSSGDGVTVAARLYDGPMPDESVAARVQKNGDLWEWAKLAKRQLHGTESGLVAFEGRPLAQEGERDTSIQRVVGQACALLHPLKATAVDDKGVENLHKAATGPEAIYALFLPAVQQFAPDDKGKPWEVILWTAICKYWAKEEAKVAATAAEAEAAEAAREQQAQDALDSIVAGVAEWTTYEPFLQAEGATAKGLAISRRLVVSPGGTYHVLQRNGYYTADGVPKDLLIPAMHQAGLGDVVDLVIVTDKGVRLLSPQEAILKYCTPVQHVIGCPRRPGMKGGVLIEDPGSGEILLEVPLYHRREDIPRVYNEECHRWLLSFGDERLLDWIAKALDLTGVMPVLSIAGPPSIGKALLVAGLTECINTKTIASDNDFGTFSPKFMRTPFLVINENLMQARFMRTEPSALIRQLTAGDPLEVNRKFKTPVDVRNPVRTLVTANNEDVIMRLFGTEQDMSPEDREALLMRLVHLNVGHEPANYLRSLGGLDYTSRPGHRWVRGPSGEPSNNILASHLLWVHENFQRHPSHDRFKMRGYVPPHLLQHVSTRSGASPTVIETLIRMIESPSSATSDGLILPGVGEAAALGVKDRIFVTSSAVIDFFRNDLAARTKKELNHKVVGSVLRGLQAPQSVFPGKAEVRAFMTGRGERKRARWSEVLLDTLAAEAADHGYKSDVLQRLLRECGSSSVGGSSAGAP